MSLALSIKLKSCSHRGWGPQPFERYGRWQQRNYMNTCTLLHRHSLIRLLQPFVKCAVDSGQIVLLGDDELEPGKWINPALVGRPICVPDKLDTSYIHRPVARSVAALDIDVVPIPQFSMRKLKRDGLLLGFAPFAPREIRVGTRILVRAFQ